MKTTLIASLLVCLLTACNFKPLYSKANYLNELSFVKIEDMNTPLGSEFTYHMERFLRSSAEYKYILKVTFNSGSVPILIQKNADVIRQSINQKVSYVLSDAKNSVIITRGSFVYDSSYNSISRPYGIYVEEENIRSNIMKYLAQEVYLRLAMYFNTNTR